MKIWGMLHALGNMNEVAWGSEGAAHRVSHCSVCSFTASPVDHSRVILQGRDPNVPGSDYINANYVKVRLLEEAICPK